MDDRIIVEDSYNYEGSFNLTYVTARKGSLLNIMVAKIMPNWDIVDLDNSRIENETSDEIIKRGQIYLKETSYDAIIAAFEEAGKTYEITKLDLTVSYVYDMANTDIKIGDTIKKINNIEVNNFNQLRAEISKYKENDKINIEVIRDNKIINCYSTLKKENDSLVIGIALVELKDIKTTPNVEYVFETNESGASRGLMCALDIYNKITEYDLTKGRKISGTGSIDENGKVGAISGVKYKILGAVKKGADIFIVPTENYEEAEKIKKEKNLDIKIIQADTLENVIEELKK